MLLPKNRPPTHPGEMLLEEFLKPLGIRQVDFAKRIGVSFVRLNSIVNGKRGITPDTALRLERALGLSADFWMNGQMAWDMWHALRAPEAKDIKKIKPVPELKRQKTA
jgi:antitoxin HigA-1